MSIAADEDHPYPPKRREGLYAAFSPFIFSGQMSRFGTAKPHTCGILVLPRGKGEMSLQYVEILQSVLLYIDEHLKEKLDADCLARRAGFSTYHFCRVFRFGVGYSPMEYVRRRRLMFAAAELSGGRKIIDLAMEYGFETHSGFGRAFRRHFGCSPERYAIHARAKRPELPSLARMQKYFQGGIVMEPKFVTLPAIRIVGYTIETTTVDNANVTAIPAFWGAYLSDGRMEKLHRESFVKNHAEYGACFPEDSETGRFKYAIGVEVSEDAAIPSGYDVSDLPPATYAVFTTPPAQAADFSAHIQGTWQFIFGEWFPSSGFEFADGCVDFEYYDERGMVETGKVCDIYIPVRKK